MPKFTKGDKLIDVNYRLTPRELITHIKDFCSECVPDYANCGDTECPLNKYISLNPTRQALPEKQSIRNDITNLCKFCLCLEPNDQLIDCYSECCVIRKNVLAKQKTSL